MSMMLKVMSPTLRNLPPELAPYEDEREYGIYSDVVDCHFRYYDETTQRTSDAPYGEAFIRLRRIMPARAPDGMAPQPTSVPPDFEAHEYQTAVQLWAEAFLMNEQGRTIGIFRPKRPKATGAGENYKSQMLGTSGP